MTWLCVNLTLRNYLCHFDTCQKDTRFIILGVRFITAAQPLCVWKSCEYRQVCWKFYFDQDRARFFSAQLLPCSKFFGRTPAVRDDKTPVHPLILHSVTPEDIPKGDKTLTDVWRYRYCQGSLTSSRPDTLIICYNDRPPAILTLSH